MITDTRIGVVIDRGIHNIEIIILDNSEAQVIDKAQVEAKNMATIPINMKMAGHRLWTFVIL